MKNSLLVDLVFPGLGLILLFGAVGCATTSDFEKLNQGLDRKLESLNTTVQEQLAVIRTELKEEITLEAGSTKKAMLEYAEKRDQTLARIEASNAKLHQELQSVRQAVAPFENLPSDISGLGSKLNSIGQALLGNYKLEEAALRDRLKIVERARKELEPAVADQGIEAKSAE